MINEATKPYLNKIVDLFYNDLAAKTKYSGDQIRIRYARVLAQVLPYEAYSNQSLIIKYLIEMGLIYLNPTTPKSYIKMGRPAFNVSVDEAPDTIPREELALIQPIDLDKEQLLVLYLTVINEYRGANLRGVSTAEYLKALEAIQDLLNRRVKTFESEREPEADLTDTLAMLRSGALSKQVDELDEDED
jgi:hypothetical protein